MGKAANWDDRHGQRFFTCFSPFFNELLLSDIIDSDGKSVPGGRGKDTVQKGSNVTDVILQSGHRTVL